ncbi:uncharacterized protein JCM10292_006679 [Rhodotorula paludigena]|uniref:uncharacterized protein n=1 Tax=Rhodotorula paludigena TaxID=86838 RepID=UPI0031760AF3
MLGLGSAVRARRESLRLVSPFLPSKGPVPLRSTFLRPLAPRAFSWDLDSPPPLVALLLRQRFAALCKVPFITSSSSFLSCIGLLPLPHFSSDDSAFLNLLDRLVLLLLISFFLLVSSCFDPLALPHILSDVLAHHPSFFHGPKLAQFLAPDKSLALLFHLLNLVIASLFLFVPLPFHSVIVFSLLVRFCVFAACSPDLTPAAILIAGLQFRSFGFFLAYVLPASFSACQFSLTVRLDNSSYHRRCGISRFPFSMQGKHKLQSASARTRLPAYVKHSSFVYSRKAKAPASPLVSRSPSLSPAPVPRRVPHIGMTLKRLYLRIYPRIRLSR